MTNETSNDEEEMDVQKNREAHFLASQQARLDKIRIKAEEYNALLDNDNLQQQRKDFWIRLKSACSSINAKISILMGEQSSENECKCDDGYNDKTMKKGNLYVTAQQRNEALGNLEEIQITIRCLSHYALHSSKFTLDEEKYLPTELVEFKIPELPTADLRLLNVEIQSLKEKAQQAQNIIIPKEKFRFRRYRQAVQKMQAEKLGKLQMDNDDIEDEFDRDASLKDDNCDGDDGADIKSPAHTLSFDGVSLLEKKNCSIIVHPDGHFTISDDMNKTITETQANNEQQSTGAKAFLIRDLDSCNVKVEGTYSSIHIINTKNTSIDIKYPIAGPVHVTGCHDTNINIEFCRQLRIHDCNKVSFNLHVASGPIIEGCKEMKFYQCNYISNGKNNFENEDNLYWDVKDFHWLKNLVKSPNFAVFSEEERRKQITSSSQQDLVQEMSAVPSESSKIQENDDEASDDDEL